MPALEQKITLITGSTKGIGAAIASAFIDNHAQVVVHGRDREEAQAELTKGSQVTVNSVLPGPTWTSGVEAYFDGLAVEEGKPAQELIDNYFAEHEPTSLIQRFVTVEEVAQATVFLAMNSAVNGSAQRVEGGIVRSI